MHPRIIQTFAYSLFVLLFACQQTSVGQEEQNSPSDMPSYQPLLVGAVQFSQYLPLLKGKRVALVVNQTSMVDSVHLVDKLLQLEVNVQQIFAPEHGFRGEADAGEHVMNGKDKTTGLPIISLYGKNKKPSPEQLKEIDVVVFDIQDVGARFYTYISTMHYVMEACAEEQKEMLVLDRPNPNGEYVDGPILEMEHQSFVGMHPIPIVHGLTVGELAQMINGEGWLAGGKKCDLTVISCLNYTHQTPYELPIKPSPNLPNAKAIKLYPSLCLFEGTVVSVGRGTDQQFQVIGVPDYPNHNYSFTPVPKAGAKYPLHQDLVCYGKNLQDSLQYQQGFFLEELIHFYNASPKKEAFFNSFFTKLAGTTLLQKQIVEGKSATDISAGWEEGISRYKEMRKQYLLYEE